jgi:molecular chaperone GrpE (heat shock protein)
MQAWNEHSESEAAPDYGARQPAARTEELPEVAALQESLAAKAREVLALNAKCKVETAQAIEEAKARLVRDSANQLRIDRARLVERLLPVLDNLMLARDSGVRRHADPVLLDGISLIAQQFLGLLRAFGVEPFTSLGERFDPKLHEAVGTLPAADAASDGVVVTELHPGYYLGDRLIRPARVLVGRR